MALVNTYTIFDKAHRSLGIVRRVLCLITCVDMELLATAPKSELKKYTSMGAAMLITTVLAFFSALIAIDYIFPEIDNSGFTMLGKQIRAIPLALIWTLIIFNLQRFVVAGSSRTADVDSAGIDDVISALPSIIMSVVIGMMVAIPLAVAIFKPEIEMNLRVDREHEYFEQSKRLEENGKAARMHACTEFYRYQMAAGLPLIRCLPRTKGEALPLLPAEPATQQASDAAADAATDATPASAAPSTPPSMPPSPPGITQPSAPTAAQSSQLAQTIEREPEPASIRELLDLVISLDDSDKKESEQQEAVNRLGGGLAYRASALFEHVPYFAYSFTLLIIFVQLTPVLIKLMSAKSAYDYLQDMLNRLVVAGGGLPPGMAETYRVAEADPAYGGIEVNAVAVYDENGQGKPLTLYHRATEVDERYQQLYKEKMRADERRRQIEMDKRYRRFQTLVATGGG